MCVISERQHNSVRLCLIVSAKSPVSGTWQATQLILASAAFLGGLQSTWADSEVKCRFQWGTSKDDPRCVHVEKLEDELEDMVDVCCCSLLSLF